MPSAVIGLTDEAGLFFIDQLMEWFLLLELVGI